jgi:nitrogen fixation-related uncharacterized protein
MLYVKKEWGVHGLDHLLLHCDVTFALWSTLFSRFQMSWVMPKRVIDFLACWWSSGRPMSAVLWKIALICLFWCLWREMNNRSFKDLESTLEEILFSFYLTLYFWTMAYVHPLSFSFDHLLARFSFSNYRCFLCILPVY